MLDVHHASYAVFARTRGADVRAVLLTGFVIIEWLLQKMADRFGDQFLLELKLPGQLVSLVIAIVFALVLKPNVPSNTATGY